jgi:diguanylate cyclase (GGDEF)-like protein
MAVEADEMAARLRAEFPHALRSGQLVRHFMELAEGAFAHAQRLGQPLVALMIDVDHFKQINDVHGHAVGDRVLADLAQSCREQVRPDDIAGR